MKHQDNFVKNEQKQKKNKKQKTKKPLSQE